MRPIPGDIMPVVYETLHRGAILTLLPGSGNSVRLPVNRDEASFQMSEGVENSW